MKGDLDFRGKFDFGGRKPDYTTPDGIIEFLSNTQDGPGAYDVVINGRDHFYIHDRTLGDLTRPEIPTQTAMRSLDNMCGPTFRTILRDNNLTAEQIHIALLQLQIYRDQREIAEAHAS